MSEFTFTSTAECDMCGMYLSSSDDKCDHDGHEVKTHVFRRIGEGRKSITGVESTAKYKWYKLEEKVGDEWIAYQWVGPRESVDRMISSTSWDSIAELPSMEMSIRAPDDVGKSED